MPGLDVVCVNYRTEHLLPGLIDAMRAVATRGVEISFVVVDCSGTVDRSCLLADDVDVRYVDPGANVGFAVGANAGAKVGSNPVIVFVNPDVILDPDAFSVVMEAGRIAACAGWTGRLLNEDGSVQRSTAPPPSLARFALEYLFGVDTTLPPSDAARTVGSITGAVLYVDRSAFERIGGFDESYPLYMEDVDLSARLSGIGSLMQFSNTIGTHIGSQSSKHVPRGSWLLLHASRVSYFRRRSTLAGWVARFEVVGGMAVRVAIGRAGHGSNLASLWRATSSRFALQTLLPSR